MGLHLIIESTLCTSPSVVSLPIPWLTTELFSNRLDQSQFCVIESPTKSKSVSDGYLNSEKTVVRMSYW